MKTNKEKIRIPIILPLGLTFLVLLGTFVVGIHWFQQQNINQSAATGREEIRTLFDAYVVENSQFLSAAVDFLKNDEHLQAAWLAGDRDALLRLGKPVLEKLKEKCGVTHFYLHDVNQVCFVRIHEPSRYGDYIDRYTLTKAVRDKQLVCGVELGPLGTLTLRCVQPWLIDGKFAGAIELGQELAGFMPAFRKMVDVEIFFTINKDFLKRENWETGLKVMEHEGNWDLLHDSAIIYQSGNQISPEFAKNITIAYKNRKKALFEIHREHTKYLAGLVPLNNVAGHEVGNIIVMKDTTASEAAVHKLLAIIISIFVVIGGSLLTFFYLYIRRIENSLTTSYDNLKVEIEKRRQTERQLQQAHDELETHIKERTAALNSAVKKLIIANQDLQELIHVTAHDLKAPLRAIGTLAEWLATDYGDKLDKKAVEQIRLITNRVNRMSNHLDAFLQYSSIGRTDKQKEEVNLNILIADIIRDLASPENIEISTANNLPVLTCELTYMKQIFRQLLANAITYMDKPHGLIQIACAEEEGFWKFSVTDNGPGIEEKYFKKIFQMFQTLTPRDEHEATGLGLSIVKRIVDLYSGRVWVESEPGLGSTFFFTFPKTQNIPTKTTPPEISCVAAITSAV